MENSTWNSPWASVIASILAPTGIGLWTIWIWWFNRKDKKEDRELTFEERRDSEIAKEREQVSKSYAALLTDLRADVDKYRNMVNERNGDRYRAWDKARAWHQRAWDMRNEAAYARQVAESLHRLRGHPEDQPPVWNISLRLPPFDEDGDDKEAK
jgi:hypothetical protein